MSVTHPQDVLFVSGSTKVHPFSSTRDVTFKTPARSFKHRRAAQDENAIFRYSGAAGVIERKKTNVLVYGTPPIEKPLRTYSKSEKISRTANRSTALSEITNKTPFGKSQFPTTPGSTLKPSTKLTIFDDTSGVLSSRRISSTRKKLRLPTSDSKNFQTPETRGNHWDVSDMSIESSVIEQASETEDHDDVEYGPPTAIDPKYEPPFDMPDYKEVGAILMSLFRQQTIPEDYDPVAVFDDTELLAELRDLKWKERLELPETPLDNVFPSVVQSEPSLATENRPYARSIQPSTRATSSHTNSRQIMRPSKEKPPLQVANVRKPLPAARPPPGDPGVNGMVTSQTRVPSLTNAKVRASQSRNFVGLQSLSHPGSTNTSRSRARSTVYPRNTSNSKPPSPAHQHTSHPSTIPDDTMQSLLTGSGDEVLGEEVLFNVSMG